MSRSIVNNKSLVVEPLPSTLRAVRKGLLTTGDCAFFCRVAPRTISKWCERGDLPHYQIPYSRDRRVRIEDLLDFLTRNKFPIHPILEERAHAMRGNGVWTVGVESNLRRVVDENSPLPVEHITLLGLTHLIQQQFVPGFILIGSSIENGQRLELVEYIATHIKYKPKVICIMSDDSVVQMMHPLKELAKVHNIQVQVCAFVDIDWKQFDIFKKGLKV